MKILFILGAYKPRASANGLCAFNVIENLISHGHSVTVLANDSIGRPDHEVIDDVEIFRVKRRLPLRLMEWADVHSAPHRIKAKIVHTLAMCLNKVQLLVSYASWPNVSPISIARFKNKALALYEANRYDMVVSIYTPIEALLAGYEVKKNNPVIFVPYFLDSLSGGYGPKAFTDKQTLRHGLKIETEVFSAADKIVLMKSSAAHQSLHNSRFTDKMVFLDIPMLKAPDRTAIGGSGRGQPIKLLFVGSIARNIRDPRTLIGALSGISLSDVIYEFVGNIDCLSMFDKLKEKLGDRLIFTDFVEHEKLSEKLDSADIFLNIGNLISTMTPSKVFEYMSWGKPIVSTYDAEHEPSAEYLMQYPLSLLLAGTEPPEQNARLLESFIEQTKGKRIPFDDIQKQFYLNTPQAFTDRIIN